MAVEPTSLSGTGISTGETVEAIQVKQIVDAFTDNRFTKFNLSGSVEISGSFKTTGSVALKGAYDNEATTPGEQAYPMLLIKDDGELFRGASASGATGPQGIQGIIGATGPQGANGAQGAQGVQGTQGITGGVGVKGAQGANGAQGVQGIIGTQGITGADGTGAQGAQGIIGIQGITGADGTGAQGAQGVIGNPGSQGIQGITGGDGGEGTQGAQGVIGNPGSQGIQGIIGTNGAQGAQGIQGTDGSGAQGAQGIIGTQGVIGIQGIQGITGSEGSGGGSGLSYNSQITYQAAVNGALHEIHVVSTGNVYGGLTWTRSSTTLSITSTAHGLSSGDYIVIRNMSEDYSYLAISNVTTNAFDVTVADSGGTGGSDGTYIPAVKAVVTGTSSISAVTLTSPSAGNVRINVYQQYSSGQDQGMTLTLPTSLQNGNGFDDKQSIFPVTIEGIGTVGTGTSSGLTPVLSYNVGTNINRISISGIDSTEADTNISIKF